MDKFFQPIEVYKIIRFLANLFKAQPENSSSSYLVSRPFLLTPPWATARIKTRPCFQWFPHLRSPASVSSESEGWASRVADTAGGWWRGGASTEREARFVACPHMPLTCRAERRRNRHWVNELTSLFPLQLQPVYFISYKKGCFRKQEPVSSQTGSTSSFFPHWAPLQIVICFLCVYFW